MEPLCLMSAVDCACYKTSADTPHIEGLIEYYSREPHRNNNLEQVANKHSLDIVSTKSQDLANHMRGEELADANCRDTQYRNAFSLVEVWS